MLLLDMAVVPPCARSSQQDASPSTEPWGSSVWPRHSVCAPYFTIPKPRAEKYQCESPTQHCREQESSIGCTLRKFKENHR